jgi:hypothetical protein
MQKEGHEPLWKAKNLVITSKIIHNILIETVSIVGLYMSQIFTSTVCIVYHSIKGSMVTSLLLKGPERRAWAKILQSFTGNGDISI